LKKFALILFGIVPHAAGIEGLFSIMSAIKSKQRNRMTDDTLTGLAQVKMNLINENRDCRVISRKRKAEQEFIEEEDSDDDSVDDNVPMQTDAEFVNTEETMIGVTNSETTTASSRRQKPNKYDNFSETYMDSLFSTSMELYSHRQQTISSSAVNATSTTMNVTNFIHLWNESVKH